MHSVLVIGCGSIGERHLRCFGRTGRARVTGCDSSPAIRNQIAKTYGVPTLEDWESAVVEGGYDLVVVATPANKHVSIATKVLHHGMHVLIEKPLSVSLADVDGLIRARDETGRQVAVAYVHRVSAQLTAARAFLLEGTLGPVRHVTITTGQPFHRLRPPHAAPYAQTYYRDHRTGGGAIQDALTHFVNWVESVIGPADAVLCDAGHQVLPGVSVEDTINVSARHGDILVNYSLNQFQLPNESTYQFNSAGGSLKIERHHGRWGTWRDGDDGWQWRSVPGEERDAPFIAQASLMLDQIEGRSALLCSVEEASQTLRFNLAALASMASGSRVSCADLAAPR